MIERVEAICRRAGGIIRVAPYRRLRVGLVTTGNEVYKGRIKVAFGPVVRAKIAGYGSEVVRQEIFPDDAEAIRQAIAVMIAAGMEMVVLTGGMSVDPDDVTPDGIRRSGRKSSPTALRCCREPCSCWPTWEKYLLWACQGV